MAWALRATTPATGNSNTTSYTITLGAACSINDRVIVTASAESNGGTPAVTSITGTFCGTFTKDKETSVYVDGSFNAITSVWSAPVTSAGTPVLTVNQTGAVVTGGGAAAAYSGLSSAVGSSAVDASGSNQANATSSTTPSATTSGNTTAANELLIGGFGDDGETVTMVAGSGFTREAVLANGNGDAMIEDKDSGTSGATKTADATGASTLGWGAVVVVYKLGLNIVQHSGTAGSDATDKVALTVTATGAGNLLICGARNSSGGGPLTVLSVSDGTSNFTQVPSARATDTTTAVDIWYLASSNSGATTITVTFSGALSAGNKSMQIWEVSGFTNPATDGVNTVNSGTGASSTQTGAAVTTTVTNGFVIGYDDSQDTITANPKAANEFTSGGDNVGSRVGGVSLISSTAASHTPVWSTGSANTTFAESTVAFKEGTAAAVARAVRSLTAQQAVARAAYR